MTALKEAAPELPKPPEVKLPGERINGNVVESLRSGVRTGMVLPVPADPSLRTVRVVPA